jgi:hypothetical protein
MIPGERETQRLRTHLLEDRALGRVSPACCGTPRSMFVDGFAWLTTLAA